MRNSYLPDYLVVWMPAIEQADPFNDLMMLLVKAGTLDKTDASIYILGLKKGIITSGDIVDAQITPRQTTAADHLRKLFNAGYFESTLGEGNRKGKGRAREFRATPPDTVLKDLLEMYQGVNQVLEKIKEHRELLSEAHEGDDEIWVIKPQKVALQKAALTMQNAKKSIKIYGHDCTWYNISSISAALSRVKKNKVGIYVTATDPEERTGKGLARMGIDIKRTSAMNIPFCLIDDSVLLLPCKGGVLENEYFVIATRQKYLVDNFVQMFEGMNKFEPK